MKTKILLITAVACLFGAIASMAQTVPSYVPTNGLVGWWPFNGNANDESGNGNNGTVNGAILTADRYGNANSAYSFDGVNNKIDFGPIDSINTFSLSFWFLRNNNQNVSFPIGLGVNLLNTVDLFKGYGIGIAPSSPPCGLLGDVIVASDGLYTCSNIIGNYQASNLGNWYHVVLVSNGSSASIFVNGILSDSSNSIFIPGIFDMVVGIRSDIFAPFDGKIDDIGIWNRALAQQEISDLYNGTSSGISDNGTWSNLSIYPNPAMDHFTVDLSGVAADDVEQIQFLNTQGQVVATRFMNELKTVQFDTQSLSAGLYMVRIQLIDGSSVSRTVVVNK